MGWRAWLRAGVAIVVLGSAAGPTAAQDEDAPAPAITSEALPDPAAEATASAPLDTPTRRPTRRHTATETVTATATETPTAIPPTPTRPPTNTATPPPAATATATPTAGLLAAAWTGQAPHWLVPLLSGGLLVAFAAWLGARLAGGSERRARQRARRTLATALLLELRRIDAVLRRVVALDTLAAFPSLDHPIIESALRDLTLFRTDTAARIAQFHGALRGIQQEIGDYRDNPLRWAGRLAELNQVIKARAAATCRAVPALIKALEREGASPPPPLGDSPSTPAPADAASLPPPPFGAHEGDDWTL